MMTPAEIRLKQNPILTSLLLGLGQGTFIAEKLFPRLPQALSSVTLAELLFGIRALPAGKRKNMLDRALTELLELFKDRVLPFDTDAARHYADLAVTAKNGWGGVPTPDGYIAAVAASRGFIVASRDTSPYEAAGVTVINPWEV